MLLLELQSHLRLRLCLLENLLYLLALLLFPEMIPFGKVRVWIGCLGREWSGRSLDLDPACGMCLIGRVF